MTKHVIGEIQDTVVDESVFQPETNVDLEYQFEKSPAELDSYIDEMAENVRRGISDNIRRLTPWFFSNMPRMYYETTPRDEKARHLSAVISGYVFENKQTIELWDQKNTKVTYIGPGEDPKLIGEMTRKLRPHNMKMGSIYLSKDRSLFLASFMRKGFVAADLQNPHIISKVTEAKATMLKKMPEYQEIIDHYFNNLDHDFIANATVTRLQTTFKMLLHMLYHEGAHTIVEPLKDSPLVRVTLGLKGAGIGDVLEHVLNFSYRYGFELIRSFAIEFQEGYTEAISVMHFIIRNKAGSHLRVDDISIKKLVKVLRTLGWVDTDDYNLLTQEPFDLSLNAANFVRAVASYINILVGKENTYYYSDYKIRHTFLTHVDLTIQLVTLFRMKFSPQSGAERKEGQYESIRKELASKTAQLIDKVEQRIFNEAIRFVDHVLKTNYFLHTKTGLAFRLDPLVLDTEHYPNRPFGIFFIIGRDYRFFQVRWKDVARGGIRIVMPRNTTDYGVAIAGLFDEVYGLSLAQQLKNKDIPEGGSKAVMVLKPGGIKNRAVKGGINALLDLLVSEDESHEELFSRQVSYYKDEEIIYLGPDENMTNDLISWATEQASRRGYKYASAFMSSKIGEGINHKEYGVTSEGLHVYVDRVLRFLKIDPSVERFSVKITGGPDGDVAGNELKILYREYGERARVVAIADGYGAAFDPNGLNWHEILRLTNNSMPISEFDPKFLTPKTEPKSFVIRADTSENIAIRNNLHMMAESDIFIPAGGRPYTVNEYNCNKFVGPNLEPTCKAIIEGANIFFTPKARVKLQELGIYIIKDSSANKTGVICSSFEIIASLILNREEFLDIKPIYVTQVIDILRNKAALEADLLLKEFAEQLGKKTLVELSMDISKEINSITDVLLDYFMPIKEQVLADPVYQEIVLRHCPPVLRDRYRSRILTKLPPVHQIAIICAYIASHIVYREGLDWLSPFNETKRLKVALTYMGMYRSSEDLVETVKNTNIEHKEEIIAILENSGARELTRREMARQS